MKKPIFFDFLMVFKIFRAKNLSKSSKYRFFRFLGIMGDILLSDTIPISKFLGFRLDRPKLAILSHFDSKITKIRG